jgi:Fe-S cluster assembly iron-binding protein IscA
LPPPESWRTVAFDFFEGRIPPTFKQVEVTDGVGFRDEKRQRRLLFSKVDLPAGGMDLVTAMRVLTEGVREQSSDPSLGLSLGPTERGGTAQHPVLSYAVRAKDRTFLQGFVGRDTGAGRLRAVMILYEDEGPDVSPNCVEQDGRSLIQAITVPSPEVESAGPRASASADPLVSATPLRFTPAAVRELRRQLQPGETVWVGVNRDGARISHLIDVGREVPSDSEPMEIDGMRVALDRGSIPLLRGTTIDFVAGAGFAFDNPNAGRR